MRNDVISSEDFSHQRQEELLPLGPARGLLPPREGVPARSLSAFATSALSITARRSVEFRFLTGLPFDVGVVDGEFGLGVTGSVSAKVRCEGMMTVCGFDAKEGSAWKTSSASNV